MAEYDETSDLYEHGLLTDASVHSVTHSLVTGVVNTGLNEISFDSYDRPVSVAPVNPLAHSDQHVGQLSNIIQRQPESLTSDIECPQNTYSQTQIVPNMDATQYHNSNPEDNYTLDRGIEFYHPQQRSRIGDFTRPERAGYSAERHEPQRRENNHRRPQETDFIGDRGSTPHGYIEDLRTAGNMHYLQGREGTDLVHCNRKGFRAGQYDHCNAEREPPSYGGRTDIGFNHHQDCIRIHTENTRANQYQHDTAPVQRFPSHSVTEYHRNSARDRDPLHQATARLSIHGSQNAEQNTPLYREMQYHHDTDHDMMSTRHLDSAHQYTEGFRGHQYDHCDSRSRMSLDRVTDNTFLKERVGDVIQQATKGSLDHVHPDGIGPIRSDQYYERTPAQAATLHTQWDNSPPMDDRSFEETGLHRTSHIRQRTIPEQSSTSHAKTRPSVLQDWSRSGEMVPVPLENQGLYAHQDYLRNTDQRNLPNDRNRIGEFDLGNQKPLDTNLSRDVASNHQARSPHISYGMRTEDNDSLSHETGISNRDNPTEAGSSQSRMEERIPDDPVGPQNIDLLKHLELEEFYPEKIGLHHVVQIGQQATKSKGGRIAWNILNNLIMLDENAITKECFSCEIPNSEENDTTSMSSESDSEYQTHPTDIFMTIFACCDLNLRQFLMQKMYQCRLALPFIFPNVKSGELTYNLWGLRNNTLVWRDSLERAVEASAVDHPINTVSCIRLGRPKLSKSKLLNEVISDGSHQTFLHKDSPNGDIKRQFTEGLIEASFFLPSGRKKDVLREPTVFLNLRGDGVQHGKQVDILSQISNVVVVSLDINDLEKNCVLGTMKLIHQHCTNIIMILGNESKLSRKNQKARFDNYHGEIGNGSDLNITKILTFTPQKEKNSSQITNEVKDALYKKCLDETGKILQDACSIMLNEKVRIDERSKHCREGKDLAQSVMVHSGASKTELLPLQGYHWKEWCRLLKSKKRKKVAGEGIQKVGSEEEQMMNHRIQQDKMCSKISPFMQNFIEGIEKTIDTPTMDFYLQWLKIFLDGASRQKLPPLQQQYHDKTTDLKAEKDHNNAPGIRLRQEERDEIERKIEDATLGVEHLMREMGQIYEAANESHNEKHKQFFNRLPELAADLLLRGHSLEIMDGDTPGVPLTWLNAVFNHIEGKTGDANLFTLAVLGLQSSGKSTLLNSMFGLKFPVSAGRCTRGVYMHLLKVQSSEGLPFKYIAILDTEGLRAQNKNDSKYEHDNELATFIIGLATLTLINVKGENLAEIKDILQIYVHAFLRMKMVNRDVQKQRSCLFIHQNISDTDANEKLRKQQQESQEQLDRNTLAAAKLENISNVRCFNDVIQFDIQKNVWYFPDLWHGTPPMASVNNEYYEKVKMLKSALLDSFAKDTKGILRFSQQKDFIKDMWYGVLADDFVFNFRNSIVTKAYKDLEKKYSELKWDLDISMKEWLKGIQWEKDGTQEDLRSQCYTLRKEATDIMRTKKEKLVQDFGKFINQNAESDIMHQWKDEKLIAMGYVADVILMSTKQDIDKTGERTAVTILRDREQDRHKQEILQKARQLADKCERISDDDRILKLEFEKMWTEWINKLHNEESSKDVPILDQIEVLLYDEFPHSGIIVEKELLKRPLLQRKFHKGLAASLTTKDVQDVVRQAKGSKVKSSFVGRYIYRPEGPALKEIKQIFEEVESLLYEISQKASEFNTHNAQAVFRKVKNDLEKLREEGTDAPLSIPINVEVRLVALVASYSYRVFQEMQERYVRHYSAVAQLNAYKNTTWKMFMNVVKQVADEICVVDVLCDEVEQQMQTMIMQYLELAVVKEIVPHFTTKAKLIKAVLIDLAEKENFQLYQSYINSSKSFILGWIGFYIQQNIFRRQDTGSSLYLQKATSKIQETIAKIKEAIIKASRCTQGPQTTQHWIRTFSREVSSTITLTGSNAIPFIKSKECNFSNLETTFVKSLDKVEGNLLRLFKEHTMENVSWPTSSPQEQILNSIWGCEAECPFCREPCVKSDPNHATGRNDRNDCNDCHMSIQHRPRGVSNWHWVQNHKLLVESCCYSVQSTATFLCNSTRHICQKNEESHPYKDYKTYVPDWDIPPSADMHSSHYWMWYITRFQREIAEAADLQLPDIPASWYRITKGRAIEGLSTYYD